MDIRYSGNKIRGRGGGLQNGRGGGEMKCYPYKKGGGLAMLKGGWGKTGFEVVTQELLLDFSHTDGGHKMFPRKV